MSARQWADAEREIAERAFKREMEARVTEGHEVLGMPLPRDPDDWLFKSIERLTPFQGYLDAGMLPLRLDWPEIVALGPPGWRHAAQNDLDKLKALP